ncbi:MAG: lasso RiPP family leader peptide-containing protein [Deltaproteobacteria bacterium]|nr:lasso RiPP family leader peptide-containing protein [Deltaproteobacteria bacterium]
MRSAPKPQSVDQDANNNERRVYSPPTLTPLGEIAKLTQGTETVNDDGLAGTGADPS